MRKRRVCGQCWRATVVLLACLFTFKFVAVEAAPSNAATALSLLQSLSIVRGDGKSRGRDVTTPITIPELVTLLDRSLDLADVAIAPSSADSTAASTSTWSNVLVPQWARGPMQISLRTGILSGIPTTAGQTISRQDAAVIFVRAAVITNRLHGAVARKLSTSVARDVAAIEPDLLSYVDLSLRTRVLFVTARGTFEPTARLTWGDTARAIVQLRAASTTRTRNEE